MYTSAKRQARLFVHPKVNRKKFLVQKIILGVVALILVVGSLFPVLKSFSLKNFLDSTVNSFSIKKSETKSVPATFLDQVNSALENKFKTTSIEPDQDGAKVELGNGTEVWFSEEKDLNEQIRSLQTLFSKATIENKQLKKVDFRFSKVIIEYN